MPFYSVVDQAIALLRQRGRVTYRALKRQFDLDDDVLEDLKAELITAQRLAVDEQGAVLVWVGEAGIPPALQEDVPHLRVLTTLPPTSPSRHLLLVAEMWACSLCQPGPHRAFLMPPTP